MASCQITADSLLSPAARSPVKTGTFSAPGSGAIRIGEQVVAYTSGYGAQALDEVQATLRTCGFTPIGGPSANVAGFTGGPLKTDEWEIEKRGDVLIEVGISPAARSGRLSASVVLSKLVSSIATKVSELEKENKG